MALRSLRFLTAFSLLVLALPGRIQAQDAAAQAYRDTERWTRASILNVARMGYFSSDRTMKEYCAEIWKATPIEVPSE